MAELQETMDAIRACYSGYLSDEKKLSQSASGGLATALSEYIISQGGIVYGVAYTSDFRGAQYIRVDRIHELSALKGSKYIQTSKFSGGVTYSRVLDDFSHDRTVLFIGLPCDVGALKTIIKHEKVCADRLLTVDLICHGPTSPKVAKEYIDSLEKRYRSKAIEFSVRYKHPDWIPPYLRAVFENGKEYLAPFYETDYGYAFSILSRPSCHNCPCKGPHHQSDMTIGDFWGLNPKHPGYNRKGVSVVFTYNSQAEDVLKKLPGFVLNEADLKQALSGNPLYWRQREKSPKRDKFSVLFEKEGLTSACRHCRNCSIQYLIKRYTPKPVFGLLKSVYAGTRKMIKGRQ